MNRGISIWKAISFCSLFWGVAGFFFPIDASAQTCGYASCELAVANVSCQGRPPSNYYDSCECRARVTAPPLAQLWGRRGTSWTALNTYPACNCSARPDLPGSPDVAVETRAGGNRCVNGCAFKPKPGPSTSTTDPGTGKVYYTSDNGWTNDTGVECNSFSNSPQEGQPAPDPIECDPSGDACIVPPDPPAFCGEINGVKICADNGECEGNAPAGYICVGAPDSGAPAPPGPPNGPGPTRPPDIGADCTINGTPCEIRGWKPPFGQPDCPEGSTRNDDGNCVPDEGNPSTCPDGSAPVNGACPAPTANCPDGTRPVGTPPVCPATPAPCADGSAPVQGACPAGPGPGGPGTVCSNGTTPVNGVCTAPYQNCPNGQPPVNGTCTAPVTTCPNGGVPNAQGFCPPGACDPLTDPDQCEGSNNDNAGGGQTCDAQPFCSGDIILCNVLAQQWQTRCATERAFGTDANAPITSGEADPGDIDAGSIFGDGDSEGPELDASGWWGGGSACPVMPVIPVMGTVLDFNSVDYCWVFALMHALVLAMAYFRAAQIVARG